MRRGFSRAARLLGLALALVSLGHAEDVTEDIVTHADPARTPGSHVVDGEVSATDELVSDEEGLSCVSDSCEVIEVDESFQQHEAPEANGLWRILTQELKKQGKQPHDFTIHYKGSGVQAVVGTHQVRANATIMDEGIESHQCFIIAYRIVDTDECAISADPELATKFPQWTHSCQSSAQCVNARGTYHCQCAADGEYGALFSGSVKDQSDPNYLSTPGYCHGFNSTETCCGVSTLSDVADNQRSIQCHSKTCVENCKRDFSCERPCDAVDRATSSRAHAIAQHVAATTGDRQQLHEYQGMANFLNSNGWAQSWQDVLQCTAEPGTASFQVACPAKQEPLRGYDVGDSHPGFPQQYVWVDRSVNSLAHYTIPALHNIELKCQETQIKTFCDPRETLQCPCHCHCADGADYNRLTGADVPLGTGFYCVPDDGFMAIEPLDYEHELQHYLSDWYLSRYPPGHVLNEHHPGKRNDTHICVDKTPPKINVPPVQEVYRQGDLPFEPPAPTFTDRNINAELGRSIKLRMDAELYGTDGYLSTVGDWNVAFSMVTPWLAADARTAQATLSLQVLDVDECEYSGSATAFQNRCFRRASLPDDTPHFERYADGVCTNIVMQSDNVGPGFTCSCPEGYAGNAFSGTSYFEMHEEGKGELRALYEAAAGDGDPRDFATWLEQERGLVGGFGSNPLSDHAEDNFCYDVQAPDLRCRTEPCPVIELEAASVEALVFTHMPDAKRVDSLLQGDSEIECRAKWDFVKKLLEEQDAVHKFCGSKLQHCLSARDLLVDGTKDYQEAIMIEKIEETFEPASSESPCSPKCTAGDATLDSSGTTWYCSALEYTVTFNVTDVAGNTARTTLNISVLPMNVTKILADPASPVGSVLEALASLPSFFNDGFILRFVPLWMRNSVAAVFGFLVLVLVYINSYLLLGVVSSLGRAVQVLVLPSSLADNRAGFDRGHVFLLWVASAGTFWQMSTHQLETILEEKWQQLQMTS